MPNITVKDAFSANVVVNTINANGQATKANSSPVTMASDQGKLDIRVIGSDASAAIGIFGGVTGYGSTRTSPESVTLFTDPFDGAVIDVTNRWNNTGTAASQASGSLSIPTGTVASAFGALTSKMNFAPPGLTFLGFGCALKLEAAVQTNTHRFWGLGTANADTAALPLTDAIGFEIGTDGLLYGVVYANTVRTATASLTLPTDGAFHKYVAVIRADSIIFYRDSTDLPVGILSYTQPNTQTLPIRIHCINGTTPPVSAPTFQMIALGLNDTGRNAQGISDGTFPHRKAAVSATGALSVTNSGIPTALGQTTKAGSSSVTIASDQGALSISSPGIPTALGQSAAAASQPVTLSNENVQDVFVTGQGTQSAAGNNVLLATAGTGPTDTLGSTTGTAMRSFYCQIIGSAGISSGQIIFEGSNDSTTFVTIPVYDSAVITGTPILAAITIAASTNRFFAGKTQYRYIRCRISTVFAGGTIQALARFSIMDYVPHVTTVGNPTAANLLATVSATNLSCNVAQINGVSPLMGNGVTGTGSPRVTIASDTTANSNPWLMTQVASAAQGAATTSRAILAATNNLTSVKASAGTINSAVFCNDSATKFYVKLYNKTSAPVVASDTPVATIPVPANTNFTYDCGSYGNRFSAGIAYAVVRGILDTDATSTVASDGTINIFYT